MAAIWNLYYKSSSSDIPPVGAINYYNLLNQTDPRACFNSIVFSPNTTTELFRMATQANFPAGLSIISGIHTLFFNTSIQLSCAIIFSLYKRNINGLETLLSTVTTTSFLSLVDTCAGPASQSITASFTGTFAMDLQDRIVVRVSIQDLRPSGPGATAAIFVNNLSSLVITTPDPVVYTFTM